jgi:hypothetical protein
MTSHLRRPSWHPTPNLAAVATAVADAAHELAERLLRRPDVTTAPTPTTPAPADGRQGPAPDLATAWEVAATLSPAAGQLSKTFQQLSVLVAGAGRDDEQLAALAAALAEAAEQLDVADDLLAVLQDPEVADRIAQLASPADAVSAGGTAGDDEDADGLDCPVTGGWHRIDWPTVRLPRGEHSVLVNCAACGQAGELNGVDQDQIDWPADLADLAG